MSRNKNKSSSTTTIATVAGPPGSHPQEHNPEYRAFLIRSLNRNDKEFAAIIELNSSLTEIKTSILQLCDGCEHLLLDMGEGKIRLSPTPSLGSLPPGGGLLPSTTTLSSPPTIISKSSLPYKEVRVICEDGNEEMLYINNDVKIYYNARPIPLSVSTQKDIPTIVGEDDTTTNDKETAEEILQYIKRIQRVLVEFLLRFKLRKKLFNRLVRRVNRLAHAMDGVDIAPPFPPKYGDLRFQLNVTDVQKYMKSLEMQNAVRNKIKHFHWNTKRQKEKEEQGEKDPGTEKENTNGNDNDPEKESQDGSCSGKNDEDKDDKKTNDKDEDDDDMSLEETTDKDKSSKGNSSDDDKDTDDDEEEKKKKDTRMAKEARSKGRKASSTKGQPVSEDEETDNQNKGNDKDDTTTKTKKGESKRKQRQDAEQKDTSKESSKTLSDTNRNKIPEKEKDNESEDDTKDEEMDNKESDDDGDSMDVDEDMEISVDDKMEGTSKEKNKEENNKKRTSKDNGEEGDTEHDKSKSNRGEQMDRENDESNDKEKNQNEKENTSTTIEPVAPSSSNVQTNDTNDENDGRNKEELEEKNPFFSKEELEYLKQYVDSYEQLVDIKTGSFKFTILDQPGASETEDHLAIKYGAGIGATHRSMTVREKEAEWKRWQTALLARIPEVPTFEDLGAKHRIFCYKERKKLVEQQLMEIKQKQKVSLKQMQKKEEEIKKIKLSEKKKQKDENEDSDEYDSDSDDDAEMEDAKRKKKSNNGDTDDEDDDDDDSDDSTDDSEKEKKKKSSKKPPEDEKNKSKEDIDSEDDENKHTDTPKKDENNDDKEKDMNMNDNNKRIKALSFAPIPSFYEQDLKRIRLIHSDLMTVSMLEHARHALTDVTHKYNNAYRASNEILDRRTRISNQLNALHYEHRAKMAKIKKDYNVNIAVAHNRWKQLKAEHDENRLKKFMPSKWGRTPNGSLITDRYISRAGIALQHAQQQIQQIQQANYNNNNNNNQTDNNLNNMHAAATAAATKALVYQTIGVTVADLVDAVTLKVQGSINENQTENEKFEQFVPPPLPDFTTFTADKNTGETFGQQYARVENSIKAERDKLNDDLRNSEKEREKLWKKMMESKAKFEVLNAQLSGANEHQRIDYAGHYLAMPIPPLRATVASTATPQQQQQHTGINQQEIAAASRSQILSQNFGSTSAKKRPVAAANTNAGAASLPPLSHQHAIAGSIPGAINAGDFGSAHQLAAAAGGSHQQQHLAGMPIHRASIGGSGGEGDGNSESKYSAARVKERIGKDGSVAPVTKPKKTKDGLYQRPAGRTRKGMEWDAVHGIWVPFGSLPAGHPS